MSSCDVVQPGVNSKHKMVVLRVSRVTCTCNVNNPSEQYGLKIMTMEGWLLMSSDAFWSNAHHTFFIQSYFTYFECTVLNEGASKPLSWGGVRCLGVFRRTIMLVSRLTSSKLLRRKTCWPYRSLIFRRFPVPCKENLGLHPKFDSSFLQPKYYRNIDTVCNQ